MNILVTGGAGFIGSNLVEQLVLAGENVLVIDDFSTGRTEFLAHLQSFTNLAISRADLRSMSTLDSLMPGIDVVIHLAANADVRWGWEHPRRDIEQNLLVTHNVLESMRQHKVRRLIFSSTGSVYGNSTQVPSPEEVASSGQTSLYGASKLAAEAFISAYAEAGFIEATVFRFVSILGPRYSHGHVFDFVNQLLKDSSRLKVLGDGYQRKSYLHVSDCIQAIIRRLTTTTSFEVLNLGTSEYCTVRDSISWITSEMSVAPYCTFTGGSRGWIGDNPFILLDTQQVLRTGWSPTKSIEQSVRETTRWLLGNDWVFEVRQ